MENTQALVNAFSGKKVKQIIILDGYCREDEYCSIHFDDGTILHIEALSDCGEPKLYICASEEVDENV